MAKLRDLPAELLLEIGRCVHPDDIESFTAISKHVRRVLQPVIEKHQALKRRFGKISCKGEYGDYPDLLTLLSKTILEPKLKLKLYVKELKVFDDEGWMSPASSIVNGKEMHPTVRQYVTREAEELDWYDDNQLGICLLPLLVNSLSGLLTLDVVNPSRCLGDQVDMMTIKATKSTTFPNVQRLNITIDEPATESSCSLYTLCRLAELPSLRILMVKGMEHTYGFLLAYSTLFYHGSGLNNLIFKDSIIDSKAMENFLGCFFQPKRLEWEEGALNNRTLSFPGLTDAYQLGLALQKHNKGTLEELIITSPQNPHARTRAFMRDISRLDKLRTLEVYPEALLKTWCGEQAVLPTSLQRLRVNISEGRSRSDNLALLEYLSRLVCADLAGLPNLESLELVITSHGHWLSDKDMTNGKTKLNDVEGLRKCCKDRGIRFEMFSENR